jgi:hypothetical protein
VTPDNLNLVLRARALTQRQPPPEKNLSKSEKAANRKLTKRVLEDQLRTKMNDLWREVQEAEAGIEAGDAGALDRFIGAAGVMIENFRLAKANFGKHRVGPRGVS